MSLQIHAKKVQNLWMYRVWCTNTDAYYTPEMLESEVIRWLIEDQIERIAMTRHELNTRLERARLYGTSAYHGQARQPDWNKIRDEWGTDFPKDNALAYLGTDELLEQKLRVANRVFRIRFQVEEIPDDSAVDD